jgi:hypothetical protein
MEDDRFSYLREVMPNSEAAITINIECAELRA